MANTTSCPFMVIPTDPGAAGQQGKHAEGVAKLKSQSSLGAAVPNCAEALSKIHARKRYSWEVHVELGGNLIPWHED